MQLLILLSITAVIYASAADSEAGRAVKSTLQRFEQVFADRVVKVNSSLSVASASYDFGILVKGTPVPIATPHRFVQTRIYNYEDCTGGTVSSLTIPLDVCIAFGLGIIGTTFTASYAIFRVSKNNVHLGMFGFSDSACTQSTSRVEHILLNANECSSYSKWNVQYTYKRPKVGLVYKNFVTNSCSGNHWTMVTYPICSLDWVFVDDDYTYSTLTDCVTGTYTYYDGESCDPNSAGYSGPVSNFPGYGQCVPDGFLDSSVRLYCET